MDFIYADKITELLFSVFSLLMLSVLIYLVRQTGYKFKIFLSGLLGYLFLFSLVVGSGLPQRIIIPLVPLLFLSVLGFSIYFALSSFGKAVSQKYTLMVLVGIQMFRLPLELLLHHWAELGTVPPTMTWTGQNWDILSGVLALLSIPFVNRYPKMAWIINACGFVLLMNVLRVVIMSSPFPFSWPLENPIRLIMYLPYAYIGPLFVGFALAFHLITFRKLLNR